MVVKNKREKSDKEFKESAPEELLELNELRVEIQRMSKRTSLVTILMFASCFVVFTLVLFNIGIVESCIAAGITAVPFIIILNGMHKKKTLIDKAYRSAFENYVVNKTLEAVFDVKEFERQKSFDSKIIKDSRIFPDFDRYWGEDYLSAEYKGAHFVQADVNMTGKEEEEY